MPLLKKILMPVAFSARCTGAVRYAEALAVHFQAQLVLLHVVEPLIGTYVSTEAMAYSSVAEDDAPRFEHAAARLRELAGAGSAELAIDHVVVSGDPAREIVAFAHQAQCDLIVMPTHGHGPFRRFLLGSVTAKVLHDADCPVWTGPHLEAAPVPPSVRFRQVVCALDLGAQSLTVLGWAARFVHESGGHLSIVHILPSATAQLGGFYFDPEWAVQMAEIARRQIAALQEDASTRADVTVDVGDTPDGVSAAAARLGAELLVIGRARHAGVLGRLRAGAYAIIRESPCPVAAV